VGDPATVAEYLQRASRQVCAAVIASYAYMEHSADQDAGDHRDLEQRAGKQGGGKEVVTHDSLLKVSVSDSSMHSSCERLKASRMPSTPMSLAKLLRDTQRPERRNVFLEA
jgi:hypothetical protein